MTWRSKQRPISSTWIYEHIKGSNLRILDIGCIIETKQPSDLTLALLGDWHNTCGVSLRDCDYKHAGFQYQKGNILKADIEDDLFDIIIASQVIGFVGKRYEEQEEIEGGDITVLKKIRGWLKDNGLFFCCATLADEPTIIKNNKKQVYSLSSIFNMFEEQHFNCLDFKTFPDASNKHKILPDSYEGVFMLNGN